MSQSRALVRVESDLQRQCESPLSNEPDQDTTLTGYCTLIITVSRPWTLFPGLEDLQTPLRRGTRERMLSVPAIL